MADNINQARTLPSIGNASGRTIGAEELELLKQVIESSALCRNNGSMVSDFEKEFADLYQVKHCLTSTSGTAAIHVALGALDIGPGDEVITTPITDLGTIVPILAQNAIPIFADLDPNTYTLDPEDVKRKITDRTKAIIVVHLFGNAADLDKLSAIADEHGITLIEDCCQAYLTEYKGKKVGTIGRIGCFSLQQSKHITTGDGGITITNDSKIGERMPLFADKGWPRGANVRRDHYFLGMNYRMTELQGAVARAQLKKLTGVVQSRRKGAEMLSELIKDVPHVKPPTVTDGAKHSYWMYPLQIDVESLALTIDEFGARLEEHGVPAIPGYTGKPVYMFDVLRLKKMYADTGCPFKCQFYGKDVEYKEGLCPQAEEALKKMLVLPWNENYSEQDINFIAGAIKNVVAELT